LLIGRGQPGGAALIFDDRVRPSSTVAGRTALLQLIARMERAAETAA